MPTKILIIRFSSIGDIVLTTPVIRCLKQQLDGESEIHFLTKSSFLSLLEANPYLSRIHTITSDVSEVKETLQNIGFDYVVDLHHNLRSAMVKRNVKALSFTLDKINWQKWLLVNLKVNRLPQKHIVDRYLETVKALGIENDGKGLDYFIPEKDHVELPSLPSSHQKGYIGFVIGGSYETKKLPVSKIVSICKKLSEPVILLGGKQDADVAKVIVSKIGSRIFNACGVYSINQSASLVKQANRIITHDTGLMHIAAAFHQNITSVWGNTVPGFGMGPYLPKGKGNSKIIEVHDLRCRPCSKLGHKKCPKKHFNCMELIDELEV